ncbi:MAG TPA: flagellar export chaperone FliS [Planctomycetota bacterium]|nr:flagellar export chaperone FliS [Planctomycetota bacterium]
MAGAPGKVNEYLKTQIQTASREQLILMLYDGAIRFADQAKDRLGAQDWEGAHGLLIRSQNIVLELLYALDRKAGGKVAENLAGLYTYCYQRLVEANIGHDPGKIDESNGILRKLREAWVQAIANLRKGQGSVPTESEQAPEQGS